MTGRSGVNFHRRVMLPAAGVLLTLAGLGHADHARAAAAEVQQAGKISIPLDKAHTIALPAPAVTVFIASPDIADVQANDPTRIVVYGRKIGATTLYITTRGGQVAAYTINVVRSIAQVRDALRAIAPAAHVDVAGAPNGLTVTGQVVSPREAQALRARALQSLGEKDSLNFDVGVTGGTQVNLQVRVAEVSRSVTRSLGFNWGAIFNNGSVALGLLTGRAPLTAGFGTFARDTSGSGLSSIGVGFQSGSANISALVDALQTEGLVTILAEPNLTTTSGETASFLSGGEFPVPVAQSLNQVTIEWKSFGVSLDFTPTVIDDGRLSIKVRPEVSELSTVGAVTINNISVPSVTVRRAETTVELASGQSFAIAGLYQNDATSSVQRFPWLGDIPVLGALFRSSSFTHNESELVIIVTPYIVRPVSRAADLKVPTDGVVFASGLEQALNGRMVQKSDPPAARPHLAGPAGFILEKDQ
jgi:pilus assembly protein CpaC